MGTSYPTYPVPAGTALTPADWCAHCEEAISPVTLPPAGRAGWVHTGTARIRCTTVAGWAEPAPRPARREPGSGPAGHQVDIWEALAEIAAEAEAAETEKEQES